jgi:UDP-hydrolysing UDP-N-acetyl-D-glucosamine 2-epimerase
VVTSARSDYGIHHPVLKRIQAEPELQLHLIATGMHLSPEFGMTVDAIESDGFEVADRVEMLLSSDSPAGIAKSMGLGTIGFAQSYARFQPDMLLVVGDRFEAHAAVTASLPFKIPVAHIHGGESTEGLIDEPIRHSITKMSHLHFPSTEAYGRRIVRMGEEPWRVLVTGAPSLDSINLSDLMSRSELEAKFGWDLSQPTLLVTSHPVTLEYENTREYTESLLAALDESGLNVIFTYPNSDTHGRVIAELINDYVASHERARLTISMGSQAYFSLMNQVQAMVGNSSSGIIEAASFNLPVVNIGNRQHGRFHGPNVVDVGSSKQEVLKGVQQAISEEFRSSLGDLVNPYGDGTASQKIVGRLKEVPLDQRLLQKCFYDGLDGNLD